MTQVLEMFVALVAVAMLAYLLQRQVRALYARRFYDFALSSTAPCPACGLRRKHEVKYYREFRQVIHTCGRCGAQWADQPVVDATKWDVTPEVLEQVAKQADSERAGFFGGGQ